MTIIVKILDKTNWRHCHLTTLNNSGPFSKSQNANSKNNLTFNISADRSNSMGSRETEAVHKNSRWCTFKWESLWCTVSPRCVYITITEMIIFLLLRILFCFLTPYLHLPAFQC
ncbi:CLUMA_CG004085, isoform A [Clunio marinus]|uniref:CLUMA_CG004085, isoform A n=1 Tax=Clunio marinus TaxID=568069 RepID=A0A1J1HS46_9DIPT|nr:CLUMA_CG004085, isoform A [Clunio marinus]